MSQQRAPRAASRRPAPERRSHRNLPPSGVYLASKPSEQVSASAAPTQSDLRAPGEPIRANERRPSASSPPPPVERPEVAERASEQASDRKQKHKHQDEREQQQQQQQHATLHWPETAAGVLRDPIQALFFPLFSSPLSPNNPNGPALFWRRPSTSLSFANSRQARPRATRTSRGAWSSRQTGRLERKLFTVKLRVEGAHRVGPRSQ